MSGMDPVLARHVIDEARSFVEAGGELALVEATADLVRVRYRAVKDADCADCVLAPADLRQFLEEMFARRIPGAVRVELEADEG